MNSKLYLENFLAYVFSCGACFGLLFLFLRFLLYELGEKVAVVLRVYGGTILNKDAQDCISKGSSLYQRN